MLSEVEYGRQIADLSEKYSATLETEHPDVSKSLHLNYMFMKQLQDAFSDFSKNVDMHCTSPITMLTEHDLSNAKDAKAGYDKAKDKYQDKLKKLGKDEDVAGKYALEDTKRATLATIGTSSGGILTCSRNLFAESVQMYREFFQKGLACCTEFEKQSAELLAVMASGLDGIEEPNKKRFPVQHQIYQMLKEEYEYAKDLASLTYHLDNLCTFKEFDSIYKLYVEKLTSYSYIVQSSSYAEYFFVCVRELGKIHQELREQFTQAVAEKDPVEAMNIVSRCVAELLPRMMNAYPHNVSSCSESSIIVERMRKDNKTFDAALRSSEYSAVGRGVQLDKLFYSPQKHIFSFHSNLMLLLKATLDARLKNEKRQTLVDTINAFNKLMTEVVNAKADSERKSILLLIGQKVRGLKGTLAEDHRILVNELDCVLCKGEKIPTSNALTHYLFLFNDCIIITEKQKPTSTDNMKFCLEVPLKTLTIEKGPNSDTFYTICLKWSVKSAQAKTFIDEKDEEKKVYLALVSASSCDMWVSLLKETVTKYKESMVFGVDLVELMKRHPVEKHRRIPSFVSLCIDYIERNALDTEGIFRLSGSATVMEKIRAKVDLGLDVTIDDPHVASGLLKNFLRSMPNPLFTYELYNSWIDTVSTNDDEATASKMRALVAKLPQAHRDLLYVVVELLHRIIEHSDSNKMKSKNMSIVMAPNVLYPPLTSSKAGDISAQDFTTVSSQYLVIERMVELKDKIFDGDLPQLDPPQPKQRFAEVVLDPEDDEMPEEVLDEEGNVIRVGPTKAELWIEEQKRQSEQKRQEAQRAREEEQKRLEEERRAEREQKQREEEQKLAAQREREEAKRREEERLAEEERKDREAREARKKKLEEELKRDQEQAEQEEDDEEDEDEDDFTCAGCGEEIEDDEDGLSALGKAWHKECFGI